MSVARYLAKPAKTTTTFPSVSTTVFTVTGGYTIGQLDVFLNGVRLVTGSDYTATNGTSFTLTAAAVSGDVVQHTVYPTSPLSFLSTGGGTVTGTVTLTSALNLTAGVKFPATPSLSADVNTLDDYEEGTWTPAFWATTTNPTVTYDAALRYGVYVKIGKTVFISGTVAITVLTAAGSGTLQISGLPFTASSGLSGGYGSLAIGYKAGWTTTTPGTAYVQATATYIQLGNEAMTASITTTNLSAISNIQFSGFYNTTS